PLEDKTVRFNGGCRGAGVTPHEPNLSPGLIIGTINAGGRSPRIIDGVGRAHAGNASLEQEAGVSRVRRLGQRRLAADEVLAGRVGIAEALKEVYLLVGDAQILIDK